MYIVEIAAVAWVRVGAGGVGVGRVGTNGVGTNRVGTNGVGGADSAGVGKWW